MKNLQVMDHVMSLAGVFQAAALVQQVAREGHTDEAALDTSIGSVFRIDAESTEAVFGGRRGLVCGLRTLCEQLGRDKRQQDVEVMRYTISMLFLERKLICQNALIQQIRDGVEIAAEQAKVFSTTHENVLARLADIYTNTVSTLKPRILVNGRPEYLNNSDNANMIRALLLAGIRAAVLWRQVGGNRVRLLLSRGRMVRCAEEVLAQLSA